MLDNSPASLAEEALRVIAVSWDRGEETARTNAASYSGPWQQG